MTRTLRNFDSAGEDQLLSDAHIRHSDEDGDNGNFDPPARERPAVRDARRVPFPFSFVFLFASVMKFICHLSTIASHHRTGSGPNENASPSRARSFFTETDPSRPNTKRPRDTSRKRVRCGKSIMADMAFSHF